MSIRAVPVVGLLVTLAATSLGAQTPQSVQAPQPTPAPQAAVPAPTPPDLSYYLDLARLSFDRGQYTTAEQALTDARTLIVRTAAALNAAGVSLPSTPVRVGGDIRMPTLLKKVTPAYPTEARAAGIQGVVFVEAVIDAQGNVADAHVVRSASPVLDAASLDAVMQWKYSPTTVAGQPVSVILTVTIAFSAQQPPPGRTP